MNLFQAYHHSNELVGWLSCLKTLFIFFVFFLFLIFSLWLSGWAAHKPFDLGFLRFSNIFKAFDRSLFGIFTNHLCGRLKHLRQFTFTTECLFTSWSFNYIIWEPPSPSPSPSSSPSPSYSSGPMTSAGSVTRCWTAGRRGRVQTSLTSGQNFRMWHR